VSENDTARHAAPDLPPVADPAVSAGALLRNARERDGLSIEDVSQQLKLAPRQVQALEDGNFALLPGRTFVRGFARNYARLLKIDAAEVLAALPGASVDSGLESPTLHATAQSIGELPVSRNARPGWIRWAGPVVLVLVVALAIYEFLLPALSVRTTPASREPAVDSKPAAAAPSADAAPASASSAPVPNPAAGIPLPNPVAAQESTPPASAAAAGAPGKSAAPGGVETQGEREIVLSYRDHSWTEVRDRNGRVLLSKMMVPGSTQALTGSPPFELVIGNAADATVTFDGRQVDLVPYTRQGVARVTLQ
jgi:cytoskeleton protein RodZ